MFFPNKYSLLSCPMRNYIKQSIYNSIQKKIDNFQKNKLTSYIFILDSKSNMNSNLSSYHDLDFENKLIIRNNIFTVSFTLLTWSIYFLSKYLEKHI